jgi:hypothetical protein
MPSSLAVLQWWHMQIWLGYCTFSSKEIVKHVKGNVFLINKDCPVSSDLLWINEYDRLNSVCFSYSYTSFQTKQNQIQVGGIERFNPFSKILKQTVHSKSSLT